MYSNVTCHLGINNFNQTYYLHAWGYTTYYYTTVDPYPVKSLGPGRLLASIIAWGYKKEQNEEYNFRECMYVCLSMKLTFLTLLLLLLTFIS